MDSPTPVGDTNPFTHVEVILFCWILHNIVMTDGAAVSLFLGQAFPCATSLSWPLGAGFLSTLVVALRHW